MQLVIASGKGGTGKTTLAVNLAYALADRGENVRLLDCDVEEPNDHLFVQPEFTESREVTVLRPVWDENKCTTCGKCSQACNYNAIAVVNDKVLIFNELCHSCGVCTYVCPEDALHEEPAVTGIAEAAQDNKPFFFAHGRLNVGEALAPNVVRAVKEYLDPDAVNIIDASPGTACPVVEAAEGAHAALLVTEPTPFGLNDLKLAAGLTLKLGVPTGIVINRSDGDDAIIARYAEETGIPIAGRIPFERRYAEVYSEGGILVREFPELRKNILDLFDQMAVRTVAEPPEDAVETDSGPPAEFAPGNARDYKEITVISGKGGTGKTTVSASLAQLAESEILADNDVDAADLHLLLKPRVHEVHDFIGGTRAVIDASRCIACGKCADACHFDAIHQNGPANDQADATFQIEPLACEGCGLCPRVCPIEAIDSEPNRTGRWFVSSTPYGPMVHAKLGIAEENSGRLVARVRERAAGLAEDLKYGLILGDGPPGTGCPVIASISGIDLVVIVTEPTVSGVHDMERVLQLVNHFRVSSLVVINKSDLNPKQAERSRQIAVANGSRVIGMIPFDSNVNAALMAGMTVVEYGRGPAAETVRQLWETIQNELNPARTRD